MEGLGVGGVLAHGRSGQDEVGVGVGVAVALGVTLGVTLGLGLGEVLGVELGVIVTLGVGPARR